MSFSFRSVVEDKFVDRVRATSSLEEVDAYNFLISSKFLDEKPFPFQRLLIKVYYGLWKKYPLDREEGQLVELLKDHWGVNLDLEHRDPNLHNEVLILVAGRRSSKSSIVSFIQTYEAYKLICKGDPQKYYGIRRKHPIQIVNLAKDGDQARDPFQLAKDNIKRIEFFQPYIDSSKDNEMELRLFTPSDLYLNRKINEYNDMRPKGAMKRNPVEGSLLLRAFTTSAASKRGKAIIAVSFDEFAHFDRAMTSTTSSEQDILNEMPQTDYAMWKAITPATKDFKTDARIIAISSPREKGGEFYKLYCMAGGREQINPDNIIKNPNFLLFQLATWEANPNQPPELFTSDFEKDPIGSNMEYGAHFGEPSSTFLDSLRIDAMVCPEKPLCTAGKFGFSYVITVDPAGRGGDTYAVAWGHLESYRGISEYHIDGVHGFQPRLDLTGGKPRRQPIDPAEVLEFVKSLCTSIQASGGKVIEICYDQWQSLESILRLQRMGFPALETTFTNKYKGLMYTDFLEKLNLGSVKCFGAPPENVGFQYVYNPGHVEQLKLELKYLQRDVSGGTVYYGHPMSGPVTTDDYADVAANLVHRLITRKSGDTAAIKEIFRQTGRPVVMTSRVSPDRGVTGFAPRSRTQLLQARFLRGR